MWALVNDTVIIEINYQRLVIKKKKDLESIYFYSIFKDFQCITGNIYWS